MGAMTDLLKALTVPCLAVVLLTVPTPAEADYINLTGAENARNIAEITVDEELTTMCLPAAATSSPGP
jgi:hypothetical protein